MLSNFQCTAPESTARIRSPHAEFRRQTSAEAILPRNTKDDNQYCATVVLVTWHVGTVLELNFIPTHLQSHIPPTNQQNPIVTLGMQMFGQLVETTCQGICYITFTHLGNAWRNDEVSMNLPLECNKHMQLNESQDWPSAVERGKETCIRVTQRELWSQFSSPMECQQS